MAEATLSSKYQLVIPKEVREQTGLKCGEKVTVIVKDGIINLVPHHLLKSMRGFLKGMKIDNFRDEEDRG